MYSGYKKQGKMPNPQDCRSYYAGYNKVEFLIKLRKGNNAPACFFQTTAYYHGRNQGGAAIIIIAAIVTPIAKSQHMREIWFYVMSGGVMLKIVVMEIARIIIQMF